MVKHYVLRQDRSYEKVRREVQALENLTQTQGADREPIPEKCFGCLYSEEIKVSVLGVVRTSD